MAMDQHSPALVKLCLDEVNTRQEVHQNIRIHSVVELYLAADERLP